MKKLTLIVLILIANACTPAQGPIRSPTRQLVYIRGNEPKPTVRQIRNQYILTTPWAHRLEVEMDYTVGQAGYINNGCQAQYIITNIGTKTVDGGKKLFTGAGTRINGVRFDSAYIVRNIVFEFTTSDGKRIEKSEAIFRNNEEILPEGKSFEARTIRIDAGSRSCTLVKPIRIEMDKQLQIGNNKK